MIYLRSKQTHYDVRWKVSVRLSFYAHRLCINSIINRNVFYWLVVHV